MIAYYTKRNSHIAHIQRESDPTKTACGINLPTPPYYKLDKLPDVREHHVCATCILAAHSI